MHLPIKWIAKVEVVKVEVAKLIARPIPASNINFIFSFGSSIFVKRH